MKSLIQWKANLWIKNKRGDCPIHETINTLPSKNLTNEYASTLAAIRYILKLYPKRINIINDEHRTPLHLAASLGDIEACTMLIQCGARVNAFMRTPSVSSTEMTTCQIINTLIQGNYITPYDLARVRGHKECAEYLLCNHSGQRGNLLANIFVRRIQKYYRQYQKRKKISKKVTSRPVECTTHSHALLQQAKVCLDNKKFDDRAKTKLLMSQPTTVVDEKHAEGRRRAFAKSKTTVATNDHSDESRYLPKCKKRILPISVIQ